MAHPQRHYRRDEVAGDADLERAADAKGREQDAADRWTKHAARIVGANIDRHRGAHPLGPDDLADHRAAHRVVGGLGKAADEAGERKMPDFEGIGPGEERKGHRAQQHQGHDEHERPAPFHTLRSGAD